MTRGRLGAVLLPLTCGALLVAAVGVLVLQGRGGFGEVGDDATRFEPLRTNVLTVATTFPSAGFWEGADVDHVTGGMEQELARELADRLEVDRVEVVDVPFDDLVEGRAHDFDVALAQISVTQRREQDVELSETYLTTPVGVVGHPGTDADDLAAAQELRWGVGRATTEVDLLEDQVRPDDDPRVYASTTDAIAGLVAGEVDVVAADYVRALAEVADDADLELVAQIDAPQYYAALLPMGSRNLDAVNAAIRELRADGTLRELRDALYERFDVDPDTVPNIRVQQ